jgi:hypothetical protein
MQDALDPIRVIQHCPLQETGHMTTLTLMRNSRFKVILSYKEIKARLRDTLELTSKMKFNKIKALETLKYKKRILTDISTSWIKLAVCLSSKFYPLPYRPGEDILSHCRLRLHFTDLFFFVFYKMCPLLKQDFLKTVFIKP